MSVGLPINITYSPRELISQALKICADGRAFALATLINIEGHAPYPVGSQMLVDENGHYSGQITGGCAEQAIADQAVLAIRKGVNTSQRYGLDSPFFDIKLPCGSGIDVFFDVTMTETELQRINLSLHKRQSIDYASVESVKIPKTFLPTPRLLLFGQGPILVKLTQLAMQTGFDVCAVAQNSETETLLENAQLKFASLANAKTVYAPMLDRYTAFVSLFHEHELETELLQKALQSECFYIGALGSRKTHAARCQRLTALGVPDQQLARIHGPVGLNIGADTPAQIALSILSDVVATMNHHKLEP